MNIRYASRTCNQHNFELVLTVKRKEKNKYDVLSTERSDLKLQEMCCYKERMSTVILQLSNSQNQEGLSGQNFLECSELLLTFGIVISTNAPVRAKKPKITDTRKITIPLFSICN